MYIIKVVFPASLECLCIQESEGDVLVDLGGISMEVRKPKGTPIAASLCSD